jgi:hypothetical protein
MSFQGPVGARGSTGPTGVTGQKGLQGPAQGPTGASFYGQGLLPGFTGSSSNPTNITLSAATSGTHYIMNPGVTTLNITPYSVNKVSDSGRFWTFQNNTSGTSLGVTYTASSIFPAANPSSTSPGYQLYYQGSYTTSFNIDYGSGVTLAFQYDSVNDIQYFVVL